MVPFLMHTLRKVKKRHCIVEAIVTYGNDSFGQQVNASAGSEISRERKNSSTLEGVRAVVKVVLPL